MSPFSEPKPGHRNVKQLAILILVAILTVISTGSAWLGREASVNNRDRITQICRNQKKLSRIEHTLIRGQQLQTKGLLKAKITFGLLHPQQELPKLVLEGEKITGQFLVELDELSRENCTGGLGNGNHQTRTRNQAGSRRLYPDSRPTGHH